MPPKSRNSWNACLAGFILVSIAVVVIGVGVAVLMLFNGSKRPVSANPNAIVVTTAAELRRALDDAQPGQQIELADGLYQGEFKATKSGTASRRISLHGSRQAIVDRGSAANGYAFYLDNASYWTLSGFTIRNAAKGIMLDRAESNVLEDLYIHNIGQEAVHFRTCSSENILRNSQIENTGVITPGFGEGVYIGSDVDFWPNYSCDSDEQDKSDDNQILGNRFGPNVSAEAVDIKEGTTGGIVCNNHFDATGLAGENFADSWMDIKGNGYLIAYNQAYNPVGSRSRLQHGFETHVKLDNWGRNNRFIGNIAQINAPGFGFLIDTADPNHATLVSADNQVSGAQMGIANIPLTEVEAFVASGINKASPGCSVPRLGK